MLKKFRFIKISIRIVILAFILVSCNNEQRMQQEVSNINSAEVSEEMTKKATEDLYQKLYYIINNEDFYHKLIKNPISIISKSEIKTLSDTVQNPFINTHYLSNIIPSSLVCKLQEVLYDTCIDLTGQGGTELYYSEFIEELGSKEYELSKEEWVTLFPEEAEFLDAVFRFYMNGNDEAYLFRFNMGGSENEYYITLMIKKNDELIEIARFGTLYHSSGKVVKYENNYYYVFLLPNYNLKCHEGIRIYKLGENAKEDNILIRYIPDQYVWINLYMDSNHLIEEYIESIQDIIIQEQYIERGAKSNYYSMLIGDEAEDSYFPLNEEYKQFFKSDFTNTGIPVYMYKTLYEPSNANNTICLKYAFYLYNSEEKEVIELDLLGFNKEGRQSDNELIQMWFKEMDGKIYTFQIYSAQNFKYILNVVLVEGNKVTPIRVDYILPKRKMVIES